MPRIPGTTNAQTIFLRAFRNNPAGPSRDLWPAPAILRKWLRKIPFRRALQSVQQAIHFQADFHLASAANQAVQKLSADDSPLTTQDLSRLLRLSHIRQRFSTRPDSIAQPADPDADPEPDNIPELDQFGREMNPCERARLRIKDQALDLGFLPPITLHPNFPEPIPQDTFYYKLLHQPEMLLWYMKLYSDHFRQDDRFHSILKYCSEIVPHEWPAGPFPHFPQNKTNNSNPQTTNDQRPS